MDDYIRLGLQRAPQWLMWSLGAAYALIVLGIAAFWMNFWTSLDLHLDSLTGTVLWLLSTIGLAAAIGIATAILLLYFSYRVQKFLERWGKIVRNPTIIDRMTGQFALPDSKRTVVGMMEFHPTPYGCRVCGDQLTTVYRDINGRLILHNEAFCLGCATRGGKNE